MKIHSLFIVLLIATGLHGQEQNQTDPFAETPAGQPPEQADSPRNISVCYEVFSVPLGTAAKLQRERKTDRELYETLSSGTEKEGIRQEIFTVIRCRSGQKSATSSVSEQLHPTEYEPPEMPNSLGVSISPPVPKDGPTPPTDASKLKDAPQVDTLAGVISPTTASSFQTREVGINLEIEAIMGNGTDPAIDIVMNPQHVTAAGSLPWGQGLSRVETPVYEVQRINTALTMKSNQPCLLGTINRPPVSKADPDSAKRVWFAFVTPTILKP